MALDHVHDLAAFVTASPSSFHAAAEVAARLEGVGYRRVIEDHPWPTEPGGYGLVRDGSVVAWQVPADLDPARAEVRMVGAHTDSPGFKLKPNPWSNSCGCHQAGVEVYGGPLLNSWLDREFGLAGQVVDAHGTVHLVRTPAWLRIPQLAPHLDRSVNDKLQLDRQQHLHPIYGTWLGLRDRDPDVLDLIAQECGTGPIISHDLISYDAQPPAIFGPAEDLFASARLDNLVSVHAGLRALQASQPHRNAIQLLACFDHEEVGSGSRTGASGPLLESVLRRIASGLGWSVDQAERVWARSFLISADCGHAVHPNYPQFHDPDHKVMMNGGPILKVNANQRYASDAPGQARWRRACAAADVPTQVFVSNNAVPCGSTIGPLSATRLGIRTVDVGVPLLSMHSARELCGVQDPGWLADALLAFYQDGA